MKKKLCCFFAVLLLVLSHRGSPVPVLAAPENNPAAETSGKIADDDLSKAVERQSKDALKNEVSRIGGGVVNAVRALFVTFFVVAVLFMGLQAAGGGLKDPRKVELIKGGGISAAVSAILVYKAEAIVAFVLKLVRVEVTEILK
jgi:hypothetical protein